MTKQLESIADVVSSRLCIGCGACVYVSKGKYKMVDYPQEGLRPLQVDTQTSAQVEKDCISTCPAVQVDYSLFEAEPKHPDLTPAFRQKWGHVTEYWEGYASDPKIRYQGSSGGALTAISAYCIEQLGMTGALHITQDPKSATRNQTTFSKSKSELMAGTGSRYSPASVCDGLQQVEDAPTPCVIVGKPAEISAVRNAERLIKKLKEKVGVTLSFFCAETPPTQATEALIKEFKVDPSKLVAVRYRGHGWPGFFTTTNTNGQLAQHWIYQKSWAYLQKFRPWSTQIWPDGGGELADISCGDPWHREPDGESPGFSLVIARSQKGKEIIEGAISTGYLSLSKAELWKIEKSQRGLLIKKGSVWGRLTTMKIMRLPVTMHQNSGLFFCWKRLTFLQKTSSILGTFKRILNRKLYKQQKL